MARTRRDDTVVTTYADHDVIMPPNPLSKAATRSPHGTDDDLIARADAALARLSDDFAAWMDLECARLDDARRDIKNNGLDAVRLHELFRAAHDIKGEAQTFGFPRAGEVAKSLCRLIERTPEGLRVPLALLDQHVDAVRAIIREAAREDSDRMAADLAARLRRVTNDFLAQIGADDLDDGDGAPPLVPAD